MNILPTYKTMWKHLGELSACYNERHRYYHDIRHVQFLINKISDKKFLHTEILPEYKSYVTSQFLQQLMEVAWFHDAYYDPYSAPGNNEFLIGALIGSDATVDVYDAILATANHLDDQTDLSVLAKVFLDLDILGFYYNFPGTDEDVRKEYWRTTDEEYSENRKTFLTKLLQRERIFYTLSDEYEIQTRINVLNKLR